MELIAYSLGWVQLAIAKNEICFGNGVGVARSIQAASMGSSEYPE